MGWNPMMSDAPEDGNWGQPSQPSVTLDQLFQAATGQPSTGPNPMAPPQPMGDSGGTVRAPQPPAASSSPGIVGMLNQLLQPYGLSTQEYQNAFLPNNNHPKLSNMFERAAYGMAMTKPGETIGENISNVAAGIIGVPRAMREAREDQMFHPLQEAGAMQNLYGMQATAQLHAAQTAQAVAGAQKENAQANYYNSAGRRQYWGDPFPAKGADGKYYQAQRNSVTGKADWLRDPNGKLMESAPKDVMPRAATQGGRSLAERMADEDDAQRDATGQPMKTPQERIQFISKWQKENATNTTAGRIAGEEPSKYSDMEKTRIDDLRKTRDSKLIKPDDKEAFRTWRQDYYAKDGDFANTNKAWQSYVNENNNKAREEYEQGLDNVRPNSAMPNGGKKGEPTVTINTDGSIGISRR